MSRIAKTGVFNADSVGVYTFAAGTPFPFNPQNPATYPAQFVQGFTDPRRPISLHRDFAPFDFAGIDRSYTNVDLFAQDDWEVRRGFTLNLGARYEKQTSSPDNNNIMPRTGFAWDLNEDGRTVVRGGYGRFYDQLFDNIPEHRRSVRHHRQLLDHADAGRQPRRVSRVPCRADVAAGGFRRRARPHGHARSGRAGSRRRARRRSATR